MLESLLHPESIAVIGASRTPGKVGHEIVANLIKGGFAGTILPINPSADEVLGLKCYGSLKDCGHTVDMSVIAVPSRFVRSAIEDSIAAGAKAVTVITAGFKEVGPEGALLERQIAELCASRGVRMLGPNCLGLINTHHNMNASFAKHMPSVGGISVLSQSGALCTAIIDWAVARGIGMAKLVSIGNKADLNERHSRKMTRPTSSRAILKASTMAASSSRRLNRPHLSNRSWYLKRGLPKRV